MNGHAGRHFGSASAFALSGIAATSLAVALASSPTAAVANDGQTAVPVERGVQVSAVSVTQGEGVSQDSSAAGLLPPVVVPNSGTVEAGKTLTFHYVVPDGGEVTVTSSDETVASVTVDPETQTVTVHAHKAGTVTITVSVSRDWPTPHTLSTSFKLTVTASTDGPGSTDPSFAHAVTIADATGGTVTSDHASAVSGERVSLSVRPDAGFRTARVTVADAFGRGVALESEGDGSYAFTMPGSSVTVRAEFASEAPKWFSDVDYAQWYAPGVNLVSSKGLMNGYGSSDQFGVGKTLTRGELACVLFNYSMPGMGPTDPSAVKNETGMADVQDGQFYTTAANWAVRAGVISGYDHEDGSKTFGPYDPVTFEQLVAIMGNLLDKDGTGAADQAALAKFADGSDVSEWARGQMAWAVQEGLVNGSEEGGALYLHAKGNVARERVAGVIKNAYDLGLMK